MAIVVPGPVQSVVNHPGTPDATYGNVSVVGDPATAWGDSSQASYAVHTILKSGLGVPQAQNYVGAVFPATPVDPGDVTLTVVWTVDPDTVGGLGMLLRASDGSYTGYAMVAVPSAGGVQTTTLLLDEAYFSVYGFGPQGRDEFLGLVAAGSAGVVTTPYQESGVAPNTSVTVYEAYLTVPGAEPPPPDPVPVIDTDLLESRRRFT